MDYQFNQKASEEAIGRTCQELAILFKTIVDMIPIALQNLWRESDGFSGDLVAFYSTEDIIERNETMKVFEYSGGDFLLIADDSGGRVAFLKLGKKYDNVYLSYACDMKSESMEDTGMTLPYGQNIRPNV